MKHFASINLEFIQKTAAIYPKWWGRLTYDEQKEYIHDHPGTDLRATAPKSAPLTGQEPITATHYSVKGRLTNESGEPVGGVIHETINVSDNRFSGAKTLQDLVNKIQQSQPKFKVVNIKPKQKVKSQSVSSFKLDVSYGNGTTKKDIAKSVKNVYGVDNVTVDNNGDLNVTLKNDVTEDNKNSILKSIKNVHGVINTIPVSSSDNTVEKVKPKPMISDKPLVVGNMAQKILFLCEMQGQISDGQWENAPGQHWKAWSNLDWDTVGVGDNIGRKFFATRDNYNFTNHDLLDVVGDRMLYKVNLYKKYPKNIEPILKTDHWLLPDSFEDAKTVFEGKYIKKNDPNDYWANKRQKLIDAGLTLEMFKDAEENPVYSKTDMIRDLKGLKRAFKPQEDSSPFTRSVVE